MLPFALSFGIMIKSLGRLSRDFLPILFLSVLVDDLMPKFLVFYFNKLVTKASYLSF